MLARSRRKMSVEQFFADYSGLPEKYELIDGEAVMMTGGSVRHADVGGNLYTALRNRLRNTSCRPFNSDTGVRIDATGIVYPDVAIYCDPRDLANDQVRRLAMSFPKVVFEVLSPGSASDDRGYKTLIYKEIPSVETIVLVDPLAERLELHDRLGPDEWRHVRLPAGSGLALRDPAVVLSFAEIFAGD